MKPIRLFGVILLIAAGLNLLALPRDAVTVGLFLFIIPGLLLLAAPNVLLYGALPYFAFVAATLSHVRPARATLAAGVALGAVIVLAFLIPQYLNRDAAHEVAALGANDMDFARAPNGVRQIGLAISDGRNLDCGSLCQRLLYNGAADRVFVASARQAVENLSGTKAKAYWIEHRPSCPATAVPNAMHLATRVQGSATLSVPIDIAAITKARIAAGDCLLSESTSLDGADVVVVERPIKQGTSPYEAPGDAFLDTVGARRLSVFQRDGSVFNEVYRRTQVRWQPVVTPLLFGVASAGISTKLGFWRFERIEGPYEVEDFLAHRLTLDVSAPAGFSPAKEREMLTAALRQEGTNAGLAMIPAYLLRLSQQQSIDPADFEIIRVIVSDDRVKDGLRSLPTYRLGPEAAALAKPLAQRLLTADLPRDQDYIAIIARLIASMPAGTMASAVAELDAVARDPARRVPAASALARLADSGPASVPRLVELFAPASEELPKDSTARDRLVGQAIGAAQGLCRLGPAAAAVRPYARMIVQRGVAEGAPQWNLPRVSILLLAHIGFEQDIADAFNGSIPRNISNDISRSLQEPVERACALGMM